MLIKISIAIIILYIIYILIIKNIRKNNNKDNSKQENYEISIVIGHPTTEYCNGLEIRSKIKVYLDLISNKSIDESIEYAIRRIKDSIIKSIKISTVKKEFDSNKYNVCILFKVSPKLKRNEKYIVKYNTQEYNNRLLIGGVLVEASSFNNAKNAAKKQFKDELKIYAEDIRLQ